MAVSTIDLRELEGFSATLSDKKLSNYMKYISKKVAHEFYLTLVDNIRTNYYGFILKPETLRKKAKLGKPLNPFIFDGDYMAAITVRGSRVYMRAGKHHSGMTNDELWDVLENGYPPKNIPPRPLWRLTKWDFEARAKDIYSDALLKYLKRGKK